MATMNRRDFFKVAGLAGAAGLTACDVQTPVEKLYPYVVQPDQLKPGIPTYFSTVCGGCASACVVARRTPWCAVNRRHRAIRRGSRSRGKISVGMR